MVQYWQQSLLCYTFGLLIDPERKQLFKPSYPIRPLQSLPRYLTTNALENSEQKLGRFYKLCAVSLPGGTGIPLYGCGVDLLQYFPIMDSVSVMSGFDVALKIISLKGLLRILMLRCHLGWVMQLCIRHTGQFYSTRSLISTNNMAGLNNLKTQLSGQYKETTMISITILAGIWAYACSTMLSRDTTGLWRLKVIIAAAFTSVAFLIWG